MSVYLDRFLNVPATALPAGAREADAGAVLAQLPPALDRQQPVDEAAAIVAGYLGCGAAGDRERLMAMMGRLLLREDRDFHTIQMVEAAFGLFDHLGGRPEAAGVLVAAARYLAAHAPTPRAQRQTYEIARRLHRGDRVFEG